MRTHVVNIRSIMGGNEEKFSQEELGHIKSYGFDEIWYHYEYCGYEGAGWLLARKEDKYDLFDLGHCSCFGPLDDLYKFYGYSLNELFEKCSKEVQDATTEFFKSAGFQQEQ